MRCFSLQIGNETRGPLAEDEITAMIAAGSVDASTPCALEGSTDWVPLSTHFSFGSTLKVRRTKDIPTAAEDEANATRIDPDLRKKLLVYGLADVSSVDGFTQVQAVRAVSAKESALRDEHRRHGLAKTACFFLAIPVAIIAALYVPPLSAALGALMSAPMLEKEPLAKVELLAARGGIKQMRWSVQRVAELAFDKPSGGISVETALANRLKINPEKSFFLSAQFSPTRLQETLGQADGKIAKERKVHLLKVIPSGRTLELLRASENALLNPLTGPQSWSAFFAQDGKELATLIKDETLRTTPAGKDDTFRFEMIAPINTSMSPQVVVELNIGGRPAFASWGAACFDQTRWQAEPLPAEYFLAQERYFVTKKTTVGAKTFKATVSTPYHSFDVKRVSPTWHYLAIARQGDTDELQVLVDEKKFAAFKVGDRFDHAQTWEAKSRCFPEPRESTTPPGLDVP